MHGGRSRAGLVDVELVDLLAGHSDRVALLLRQRRHGARVQFILHSECVHTVRDTAITAVNFLEHDQPAPGELAAEP